MASTKAKPPQRSKRQPRRSATRLQELQLELIEFVNFNRCKGSKVAKLLRDNRQLWRVAFMPAKKLYALRALEDGDWPADTLFLLPVVGQEDALEKLAGRFSADEVNWLGSEKSLELMGYWLKNAHDNPKFILSVWWD